MRKSLLKLTGIIALTMLLAGAGNTLAAPATPMANPAEFSPTVTNPFFPLAAIHSRTYAGEETDPDTGKTAKTGVEETVLTKTDTVAGIKVAVVDAKDFSDGELVEETLDYYAQHSDGTVYYFGERIDQYENGKIVGHEAQWLASDPGNQPGVFMPSTFKVGQTFAQEQAPGVAEDTSTIGAVNQNVTVVAGSFSGCIQTKDFDPLNNDTEFKTYCPGIGLVREEYESGGHLDLIRFEGGVPATPRAGG